MPPSRSRGGDPAPAAVERTAGCRSGGSLSTPAAHPPHGGDPKTAPAVGAVRDASTGTGVDIRERRLHKDGTPVKVSRPTAPDGFDEASAAPGQYHRLSSLPRHPSLQMRGQMGSGQSPAFCLPVVNGLVASDPAGGTSGGSTGRDAYHHGKTPGALLLLLVPTGKLPAKASVARSWSRLPPSMVRACFFTWVLFLLCAGVRRMLDEDRKHKCNNSQSLVFRIVSTVAPIISFFANIAPSLNVYEIGQVEERRKILLASSSTFISASSFSWSCQSWEAEVLFTISTLISSGSRLIDLCMQCYFHRAPEDEDAPHDPPLDLVNPEDDVQDSNQLAALHAAHVPPLGQVVPEDIVQDSNQIPVPLGGAPIVAPNVAGVEVAATAVADAE
ncbi:hypothetical protein ZWY2020_029849 [Hordeum vulgare]|nr:hypothetical protein ZWY2020_029849 [Hordeum vulgare]